ncbi:MAG TPA: hypothetical protein VLE69_03920 [Candidatus Saccharimonadales bacterium]|nr:hypothetical protein [Candidatus Saccharimonadales bacterium]
MMVDRFDFDDLPPVEEVETDDLIRDGILTSEDLEEATELFGSYDASVKGAVEASASSALIDEAFRRSPEVALRVLEEALHWSLEKRQDLADQIRAELEEGARQEDPEISLEELEDMDYDDILQYSKRLAQEALERQEN